MTRRTMRPALPIAPLGFRRDGRPILPILGASRDDPGDFRSDAAEADPVASETGAAMVTIAQQELSRRFTREKDQGRRAGVRDLLSQLGFDSAKALSEYVQAQREVEQTRREAERAHLSEVEQREQAAAEREQQAQDREAAASAREREAARRALLVGHGATGTDLDDAVVLLERLTEPDADGTDLDHAVEELKARRPELFGRHTLPNPAPSGAPDGIPASSGRTPARPGSLGLDMARRRGHLNDA